MKVDGVARRSIQLAADGRSVEIVDQTLLPHRFVTRGLRNLADAVEAIRSMRVRGAPLIGATAAYGVGLQMREEPSDASLKRGIEDLLATRPTAVNLRWALEEMRSALNDVPPAAREERAYERATEICDEDVENCRAIGEHGFRLIEALRERRAGAGSAECPDALQRWMAGGRRLGDGARTRLSHPRSGNPDSRLGR